VYQNQYKNLICSVKAYVVRMWEVLHKTTKFG